MIAFEPQKCLRVYYVLKEFRYTEALFCIIIKYEIYIDDRLCGSHEIGMKQSGLRKILLLMYG